MDRLLIIVALAWLPVMVVGQATDDTSPAASPPEPTAAAPVEDADPPPEAPVDEDAETEAELTEDATDDAAADAQEADEAAQMRAKLERFVPSEQISEDNSIAYPNDI